MFGSYVDPLGGGESQSEITGRETLLGRTYALDEHFYGGSAPPDGLPEWDLANGRTPLVTTAFGWGTPLGSAFPGYASVTSGAQNAKIDDWAAWLLTLNDTIILRLFQEFQGNWFDFGYGQNTSTYNPGFVNMWRYIWNRWNNAGVDLGGKVQICWCPNTETNIAAITQAITTAGYPGDSYVDCIGIDLYNKDSGGTGAGASFQADFQPIYTRYSSKGKPFLVPEFGCVDHKAFQRQKWLDAAKAYIKGGTVGLLKGIVYWDSLGNHDNVTGGQFEYRVNQTTSGDPASATASLNAWKAIAADPSFQAFMAPSSGPSTWTPTHDLRDNLPLGKLSRAATMQVHTAWSKTDGGTEAVRVANEVVLITGGIGTSEATGLPYKSLMVAANPTILWANYEKNWAFPVAADSGATKFPPAWYAKYRDGSKVQQQGGFVNWLMEVGGHTEARASRTIDGVTETAYGPWHVKQILQQYATLAGHYPAMRFAIWYDTAGSFCADQAPHFWQVYNATTAPSGNPGWNPHLHQPYGAAPISNGAYTDKSDLLDMIWWVGDLSRNQVGAWPSINPGYMVGANGAAGAGGGGTGNPANIAAHYDLTMCEGWIHKFGTWAATPAKLANGTIDAENALQMAVDVQLVHGSVFQHLDWAQGTINNVGVTAAQFTQFRRATAAASFIVQRSTGGVIFEWANNKSDNPAIYTAQDPDLYALRLGTPLHEQATVAANYPTGHRVPVGTSAGQASAVGLLKQEFTGGTAIWNYSAAAVTYHAERQLTRVKDLQNTATPTYAVGAAITIPAQSGWLGTSASVVVDAAPTNLSVPVITPSGTPLAGTVLFSSPGTWDGSPTPVVDDYLWQTGTSNTGPWVSSGGGQKLPIIGADLAGANTLPGGWDQTEIAALTLHVNWSDLQATQGGAIGGSGKTLIDNAVTYANAHPGLQLKIRVFCNGDKTGNADTGCPAWLKAIVGTFPHKNTQQLADPVKHFVRVWDTRYGDACDDFQSKMAALYDAEPVIHDITASGVMYAYAEPMIADLSSPQNRAEMVGGGTGWDGTVKAVPGAGYTNAAWKAALKRMAMIHANHWKETNTSLQENPYGLLLSKAEAQAAGKTNTYTNNNQYFKPQDEPGLPNTFEIIDHYKATLGGRFVQSNASARPDFFTYDTAGKATGIKAGSIYGQLYAKMVQVGNPIFIQTANLAEINATAGYADTGKAFAATMDGVIHILKANGFEPNQVISASASWPEYQQTAIASWNQKAALNPTGVAQAGNTPSFQTTGLAGAWVRAGTRAHNRAGTSSRAWSAPVGPLGGATSSPSWAAGSGPTITGTAAVGSSLDVDLGSVLGSPPPTAAYQWLDSATGLANSYTAIPGATSTPVSLVAGDAGHYREVRVTLSNGIGSPAVRTSPRVGPITGVAAVAPTMPNPPTIQLLGTSQPKEGIALRAVVSGVTGTPPFTYAYQWQLCNAAGGSCADITDATGEYYTPQPDDVGSTLRVDVTVTNSVASDSGLSLASGVVLSAGEPPPPPPPPPVPEPPPITQSLGCGLYDVMITSRGGDTIRHQITQWTGLRWSRAEGAPAAAAVDLSGLSASDLARCCYELNDVLPWADELALYRRREDELVGTLVWCGPIGTLQLTQAKAAIPANDLLSWFDVRFVHHDSAWADTDLTEIAASLITDGLAPDPSPGITLAHQGCGIRGSMSVLESEYATVGEKLRSLVEQGLRLYCTRRTVTASGFSEPDLLFSDASFDASPQITLRADSQATRVAVTGQQPIQVEGDTVTQSELPAPQATSAAVDNLVETYGLIERAEQTDSTLPTSVQGDADRWLAESANPVAVVESGVLSPAAALTIDDLAPGRRCRVRLVEQCYQIDGLYRLSLVEVEAAGGSEKITVHFVPLEGGLAT